MEQTIQSLINLVVICYLMSQQTILQQFNNNRTSRCSSLFAKTIINPSSFSTRTRSQSNISINSNPNKFGALSKAMHTINIKLKKLNYFFFCRLQAHTKMRKNNIIIGNDRKQELNQLSLKTETSAIIKRSQSVKSMRQCVQQKLGKQISQQYYKQGIEKLTDSINMLDYKIYAMLGISTSFKSIKNHSHKKQSITNVINQLKQISRKLQKQTFKKLYNYEQQCLKIQIIVSAMNHFKLKNLQQSFINIKYFASFNYIQLLKKPSNESNIIKQQTILTIINQQKIKQQYFNQKQAIISNRTLKQIKQQISSLSQSDTYSYRNINQQQLNSFLFTFKDSSNVLSDQLESTVQSGQRITKKISISQNVVDALSGLDIDPIPCCSVRKDKSFSKDQFEFSKNQSVKINTSKVNNNKLSKLIVKTRIQQQPLCYFQQYITLGNTDVFMNKINRLYPENNNKQLPDFCDNLTIFNKDILQNQQFKHTLTQAHEIVEQQENAMSDRHNPTVSVSLMRQCKQKHKKIRQKSIKQCHLKLNSGTKFTQKRRVSGNTSPFNKIDEMMKGLELIRSKQILMSKISAFGSQCNYSRAQLTEISPNKEKNRPVQQQKNAKQQSSIKHCRSFRDKENIQSKLMQIKDKYFFYPTQNQPAKKQKIKIKNKEKAIFMTPQSNNKLGDKSSSHRQYPITTARKMQLQIDSIINTKNKKLIEHQKSMNLNCKTSKNN